MFRQNLMEDQQRIYQAETAWDTHFTYYSMIQSMRQDDRYTLDDIAAWWEKMKQQVQIARSLRPEIYNQLEAVYE